MKEKSKDAIKSMYLLGGQPLEYYPDLTWFAAFVYNKDEKLPDMTKDIIIKSCWNQCDFYSDAEHIMQCDHPYWEDKPAYANCIITHENSRDGKIPIECPLRNQNVLKYYKLSEDCIK